MNPASGDLFSAFPKGTRFFPETTLFFLLSCLEKMKWRINWKYPRYKNLMNLNRKNVTTPRIFLFKYGSLFFLFRKSRLFSFAKDNRGLLYIHDLCNNHFKSSSTLCCHFSMRPNLADVCENTSDSILRIYAKTHQVAQAFFLRTRRHNCRKTGQQIRYCRVKHLVHGK